MADKAPSEFVETCRKLFENTVDHADGLYDLGAAFLIGGLFLMILRMFFIHFAQEPNPAPRPMPRTSTAAAATLIKAATEFAKAIASAPAPVVILLFGLLLVWMPYEPPSPACATAEKAYIEATAAADNGEALIVEIPDTAPSSIQQTVTDGTTKTILTWTQGS